MSNVNYIAIAKAASLMSKDRTKIGAVAQGFNRADVGIGFNGYPPGYDDTNFDDKYEKVIHAEMNAIINSRLTRGQIQRVYIYGLPPCKDCMKHLAAYGVLEVVYCVNPNIASSDTWRSCFESHKELHPYINFLEIDHAELDGYL